MEIAIRDVDPVTGRVRLDDGREVSGRRWRAMAATAGATACPPETEQAHHNATRPLGFDVAAHAAEVAMSGEVRLNGVA